MRITTPEVKPEWRTENVVLLCRSMREAQDYSACPILADALEEGNCDDVRLLEALRGRLEHLTAGRLVAAVYSAESADAVKWLEQFVRDINYDDNDGYDEEKGAYVNERPSDTNPHDYDYVVKQGYSAVGGVRPDWIGQYDAYGWGGGMHFGSDAGADHFRASDDNKFEFFRYWSLATGLPGPADPTAVYAGCAC